MILASSGLPGGPLGGFLGRLGGLLGASWAVLGHLEAILSRLGCILGRLGGILGHLGGFGGLPGPSWKPSWASWTPWRAPGTCLGADRASGRSGGARGRVRSGGGGALRRLQKPYQTALGILARLNVPGGTVADNGKQGERWYGKREGGVETLTDLVTPFV